MCRRSEWGVKIQDRGIESAPDALTRVKPPRARSTPEQKRLVCRPDAVSLGREAPFYSGELLGRWDRAARKEIFRALSSHARHCGKV
jgi:hypothetical protein